jgi:hypothetical protein
LWARHDVRALTGAPVRLNHPTVGPLELRREKLPIGASDGQLLVIYHAEPGSAAAAALERLRTPAPASGTSAALPALRPGDARRP